MIEEILPDLFRLEIPLPRNPLRSINSYLVRGEGRSLLIDTGMRIDPCREALNAHLAELGVALPETDLFITHLHIDHLGLAKELTSPTQKVFMGERDAEYLLKFPTWQALFPHMEAYGFPARENADVFEHHSSLAFSGEWWPKFVTVKDGEKLSVGRYEFTCVETPGHTPGHMCLYEQSHGLLLSGDHVLGDISPNITGWDNTMNQLGDYLGSLEKVRMLDVRLVLPGHRSCFADLAARVDELRVFHERRLAEVLEILGEGPLNGYDLAGRMSWDITFDSWETLAVPQRWFATGEALSHVRHLASEGRALETLEDGVLFYSLPA